MNMSRLRSRIFCAAMGLLAFSFAQAQTVTINLTASRLYDSSGTMLNTGGLVLLVADTSHNGFGSFLSGSSLSAGSFLNVDDQILGFTTILGNGTGTAFSSFASIPLASSPYTNLTTGDPLAVVWFSTLTGSSTTLAVGNSYGLFSSTSLSTDGDPWATPADGATIDLVFKTLLAGGTHAESEAYAAYTVSAIPEPSTYAAIVGSLILGVAFRRRRKAGC